MGKDRQEHSMWKVQRERDVERSCPWQGCEWCDKWPERSRDGSSVQTVKRVLVGSPSCWEVIGS